MTLIPFQKKYGALREGLLHLSAASLALLLARFHLMGSTTPDFSPADNPASDSLSLLTRTLTFLHLPALNFWLLLCPRWLSFDWSMEAVPLITTLTDPRNVLSIAFYAACLHFLLHASRALASQKSGNHGGCNCSSTCCTWNHRLGNSIRNSSYKHYSCVMNNNNNTMNNGAATRNVANRTNGAGATRTGECPSQYCFGALHSHADAVILSGALMALPFLPATNLFFYVGFVVAERVLYIPSMGFCLLVALGLDQLYRRQESVVWRRLLLAVFAVLLVTMSVRTVRRNRDWWNEENLYRSGIPINPPKGKIEELNIGGNVM